MPDDIIDKVHRMPRQQKNNPGLIFADRNLQQDEWDNDDDDEDDETYHDDDDDDDDNPYDDDDPDIGDNVPNHHNDNEIDEDDDNSDHDDEGGGGDDNEDDDNDGAGVNDNPTVDVPSDNEMESGEPLIANAPPLDGIQQIPDNPPGGFPGVGIADEGEDGVAMNHDIPGDTDDETSLGIPGVDGSGGDDTADEQAMIPPDANTNTNGGYGLRNNWGRNYNHRYAGRLCCWGRCWGYLGHKRK